MYEYIDVAFEIAFVYLKHFIYKMFNTIKYNISISLPFHHFMHGQCNLQNNIYNGREGVSSRAGVF